MSGHYCNANIHNDYLWSVVPDVSLWCCRKFSALVAFLVSLLSRGFFFFFSFFFSPAVAYVGRILKLNGNSVNTPDPIRKRFGYGQRAVRIGPDRKCRIRLPASFLVPVLQRRHGPHCAKPTRIRSEWPGQGLAKLIWSGSKPVCRIHRARFLAGRNRPATSFPLLDSVPFFHKRPG